MVKNCSSPTPPRRRARAPSSTGCPCQSSSVLSLPLRRTTSRTTPSSPAIEPPMRSSGILCRCASVVFLGNPIEQARDGAKGGAFASFVSAVDDLNTARCEIDLGVGERAERQKAELEEPHKSGSLASNRGMSISSTSPRSSRRYASSRTMAPSPWRSSSGSFCFRSASSGNSSRSWSSLARMA